MKIREVQRGYTPRLLVALALVLGCQRSIPGEGAEMPPAPPPPTVAEPPPPPPPPPPPKCEAMEENCRAEGANVRARIQSSGWEFGVPAQWKYAQMPTGTIAITETGALAMGVGDKPEEKSEKAKKDPKAMEIRDGLLLQLAEKTSVTLTRKKGFFSRRPDRVDQFGDLKLSLFQLDGAKRETQKGAVLMFTADLPDNKVLVGVGFVADDDKANADEAIMTALRSLARSSGSGATEPTPAGASSSRPTSSTAPAAPIPT